MSWKKEYSLSYNKDSFFQFTSSAREMLWRVWFYQEPIFFIPLLCRRVVKLISDWRTGLGWDSNAPSHVPKADAVTTRQKRPFYASKFWLTSPLFANALCKFLPHPFCLKADGCLKGSSCKAQFSSRSFNLFAFHLVKGSFPLAPSVGNQWFVQKIRVCCILLYSR
jgi:hypothetical protein